MVSIFEVLNIAEDLQAAGNQLSTLTSTLGETNLNKLKVKTVALFKDLDIAEDLQAAGKWLSTVTQKGKPT